MTKTEKTELLLNAALFTEFVRRDYGIADDAEPGMRFEGSQVGPRNCRAYYSIRENTLVFRPNHFSPNVLAHELAHWVQYQLRGDTDCYSTPARRRNFVLAAEHWKMQDLIEKRMKFLGYTDALIRILG